MSGEPYEDKAPFTMQTLLCLRSPNAKQTAANAKTYAYQAQGSTSVPAKIAFLCAYGSLLLAAKEACIALPSSKLGVMRTLRGPSRTLG